MTRFGAMKHLRVLEEACLVPTRRAGRLKLHFPNPVPIGLIHDRWIDTYTERHVSALADVFIKATPERIWEAITRPEFTARYFHQNLKTFLAPGAPMAGF
jgi:hypothetical protein